MVFLCGPPCSGKTTLAHHLAQSGGVVLDYDTIARDLGSPAQWIHPEPWRTAAEQDMQAYIVRADATPGDGTAWVIRTAPRPSTRHDLATQWHAEVYVLDPGERECRRRARADHRPSGTGQRIGEWYHRYRPWHGDLDPTTLDPWSSSGTRDRGMVMLNPEDV